MPRYTLPAELKDAIIQLTPKEKNQLIFRLLKKDIPLANRLFFELVSDETVEEKRDKVQSKISEQLQKNLKYYLSAKKIINEIRSCSSLISKHVFETKDKLGEVSLLLFVMNTTIKNYISQLNHQNFRDRGRLQATVMAKIFRILLLTQKLHPDYLLDLQEDFTELAKAIEENPSMKAAAKTHGLDLNWLNSLEIPEDLPHIYKELRQNGYLK